MVDEYQHLRERGLTQESIFRGNMIKLRVDTVALPNGETAQREIIEHPGAVAIVPLTEDNQVIMVRQFRYPINAITLELPAGKLEWGEEPEGTLHRELAEETGLKAGKVELLGEFYPAPGYSNEKITIYLARELAPQVVVEKTDEEEFLEPLKMPFGEALSMVEKGEIRDAKTIIGLEWAKAFVRE